MPSADDLSRHSLPTPDMLSVGLEDDDDNRLIEPEERLNFAMAIQ